MDNSAADALSQLPTVLELGVISVMKGLNTAAFNEQVEADLTLRDILQLILTGQQAPEGYTLKGGAFEVDWFYRRRHLPFCYY